MSIQEVLKQRTIRGPIYVDCPGCDGKMVIGRYVCVNCKRVHNHVTIKLVLQTDKPEFIPKRSGRDAGCKSCGEEIREECHRRISNGGWLLCEIPDAMDYLAVGILEPDDLRDIIVGNVNGKENIQPQA